MQSSKQAEKKHKKELAAIVTTLRDNNEDIERLQILIQIIQLIPPYAAKRAKGKHIIARDEPEDSEFSDSDSHNSIFLPKVNKRKRGLAKIDVVASIDGKRMDVSFNEIGWHKVDEDLRKILWICAQIKQNPNSSITQVDIWSHAYSKKDGIPIDKEITDNLVINTFSFITILFTS
ncbi:hypothetical protein WN943_001440 [Citrus x changshan-huyou]